MKKTITIILAVLLTLTAFTSVSTTANTEVDINNTTSTTATTVEETTTEGAVQITESTKRIPLKKPKISKIAVGKFNSGNTVYRYPKITFNKIPNATRYRVAFKCPNKPNKWQYFTTKKIKC